MVVVLVMLGLAEWSSSIVLRGEGDIREREVGKLEIYRLAVYSCDACVEVGLNAVGGGIKGRTWEKVVFDAILNSSNECDSPHLLILPRNSLICMLG